MLKPSANDGGILVGLDSITRKRRYVDCGERGLVVDTGVIRTIYGTDYSEPVSTLIDINHNFAVPTNSQKHKITLFNNGTVASGSYGNSCDLTITTDPGSTSNIQARRVLRQQLHGTYRARSAVKFNADTSLGESLQLFVIGNSTTSYSFAYVGAGGFFGILYLYGGAQQCVEFTVTAAATGVETATVTLNGVAYLIDLTAAGGDLAFTGHQIEMGGTGGVSYDDWLIDHVGDKIIFIAQNLDARPGVYSFSSATATATATVKTVGVATNQDFYPQAGGWNGTSPMITSLDPTKWNQYQIKWGLGIVEFCIFNPDTRVYEFVHSIGKGNSTSGNYPTPHAFVQHLIASTTITGVPAPMTLSTAGTSVDRIGGAENRRKPTRSFFTSKTLPTSGTEYVIVAFSGRSSFNYRPNEAEIVFNEIIVANDSGKSLLIKFILNPTTLGADIVTNYTSFEYLDEFNSPTLVDTGISTYTGGSIVFQLVIGKNSSDKFIFGEFVELFLQTEDTVIITGTPNINGAVVDLSVIVTEDL